MSQPRFFFVHVMKAAGTSFLRFAQENLSEAEFFFGGDKSFNGRYGAGVENAGMLDVLLKNEPEIFRYLPWGDARFFNGHMPFAASSALRTGPSSLHCLTILRNPVDRVASHLLQTAGRRYGFKPAWKGALALYEQPRWWSAYGHNYQTRLFAMNEAQTFVGNKASPQWFEAMQLLVTAVTAPDPGLRREAVEKLVNKQAPYNDSWGGAYGSLEQLTWPEEELFGRLAPDRAPFEISEAGFAAACERLEQCAVVGLADAMEHMRADMQHRFGWRGVIRSINPGPAEYVPAALSKRIARDNEVDMAFYHFARKLVQKRRRQRMRGFLFT